MQEPAGPAFARFLNSVSPGFRSYRGISVLEPVRDHPEAAGLVNAFCSRFYKTSDTRVLVLGINPGRKGGGMTGIPFTDPVALEEICGISNSLHKERELSSSFVYEVVSDFGGPDAFYQKVLLSAVCPVGFVREGRNFNYYDDDKLLHKLNGFLFRSMEFHASLGVRTDVVISLGKENAFHIRRISKELGLFKKVVELEHPRFVMQYRRSRLREYVQKYRKTILEL